jgi:hypothetical protein
MIFFQAEPKLLLQLSWRCLQTLSTMKHSCFGCFAVDSMATDATSNDLSMYAWLTMTYFTFVISHCVKRWQVNFTKTISSFRET